MGINERGRLRSQEMAMVGEILEVLVAKGHTVWTESIEVTVFIED